MISSLRDSCTLPLLRSLTTRLKEARRPCHNPFAGAFGKPRPAVIVQPDQFAAAATVMVLLLTSTPVDAPLIRLPVTPTPDNGLRSPA